MIRETELFFDEVLKNDLSLTNFVASDFTMLNGRLAKHYGIPGVDGWEFRKVTLPPGSHRGGVLTMASVLKVTANGTTTSPVLRGAWVLDRILGTPPPPPPDDVPALEPDIRGATTIREQLAKHRSIESCARLSSQDRSARIRPGELRLSSAAGATITAPPGSAKTSSSTAGGCRISRERRWTPPTSWPTASGSRTSTSSSRLLLQGQAATRPGLDHETDHLRHGPGAAGMPTRRRSRRSSRRSRAKNYGLRSLIHEIVQSELFRSK